MDLHLYLHLHGNGYGNEDWDQVQATTKFYGPNGFLPAQHTQS